ncbi:RNA polymerase sigma factor, sigma-70 family [Pseudarcicella hirudinis]|uniref:RNA polymerase sigma factor, sigma-70 family n=1 Tax=Pseudarcicella hirudinis TaxID=1079859 RepID=A0A1I5MFS8_9BACT|nr:sigma-70 family RNA polymerase sigma factor [Pseudarcicella hirudinis]SFP08445.1 RNA polymerase sigma factor, sigma-70 family [Pseudarcicella hirudinis]
MTKIYDEEALWDAFRTGDHEAFTKIYKSYVNVLYSYSTGITQDRELIKDCLHDLFVELWRNHATIGKTTSIKYYLMASIKRKLVRQLENQQKHFQHQANYYSENPDFVLSHETAMLSIEDENKVGFLLNDSFRFLSKRQKEALSLRYFHDMDTDQISTFMKINPQSVYNLIFGALKILKEHLRGEQLAWY